MKLTSILATVCTISLLSSTARACPTAANPKKARVATVYFKNGANATHRVPQRTDAQTPEPITDPGSPAFAPNYDTGALDRS